MEMRGDELAFAEDVDKRLGVDEPAPQAPRVRDGLSQRGLSFAVSAA